MDRGTERHESKTLPRLLLFGALVAGIAAVVTLSREAGATSYQSVKPPETRAVMPSFSWTSVDGQKWDLKENRGSVVLLNFWATWCRPCREETPDIVRVYENYRGRGVTVAGVTVDKKPLDVVPAFVNQYRVSYPILIPVADSAVTDAVQSIPTSFLLDRKGRIARVWIGLLHEKELSGNIEELLAEAQGL
ncbi:MAG: redoxin domain-containing protein [Bryobacteraceae bacterium]|nr:redoxin domain-containing protein [Bryobacteraceae bacterium]